MKMLKKNTRRAVLSLHILFCSLWTGAALSMVIVMFFKNFENASELLAYNWSVKLIDDFIVIGSATGAFLTGIILSWKTPWGFFKHWWIIIKIVSTVFMILLGTFWLGPWTNGSVTLVESLGYNALTNETYLSYQMLSKFWGTLQVALISFLFFISVIKPFKRIK